MTDEPDLPTDDPHVLAGELALGVLEGPERAAALRRLLSDPAFAREVDMWRERFASFNEEVEPITPPSALWRGIERRLAFGAEDARAALRRWRWASAALAATAAALLSAIVLRVPPTAPASQPQLVAQLGKPGTTLLAVYQDRRGELLIQPAAVEGQGRDPELWVIPVGGTPVSLGVISRDRPTHIALGAKKALLANGATLAVSLEPIGGSPTGQPTGPVVAQGSLSRT